jgi:hypothetical protein
MLALIGTQPTERGVKHTREIVRNKPKLRAEIARAKGMTKANDIAPDRYNIAGSVAFQQRERHANGTVTGGTLESRKRRRAIGNELAAVNKRHQVKFRSTKYELFCRGKHLLARRPTDKEIADAPEVIPLPYEEESMLKATNIAEKCWEVLTQPPKHGRKPHATGFKPKGGYKPKLCAEFTGKVKPTAFKTILEVEAELHERNIVGWTPRAEGGKLSFKELRALLPVDGDGYVLNGRLSDLTAAAVSDPFHPQDESAEPAESFSLAGWVRSMFGGAE